MAIPAYTDPPGELMYMYTSLSGLSDWRRGELGDMTLATSSLIALPRNTIRSISSREKMS